MSKITLPKLLLISFCIFFIFANCKNEKKTEQEDKKDTIVDKTIVSIDVLYYNYLPDNSIAINPNDIKKQIPDFSKNKNGVLDASISDSSQISQFDGFLKALKPDNKNSVSLQNSRIVATIKHKDGSTSRLTLNDDYANIIYLDGIKQMDNNEFVFFIKNRIGYYPWFIGDALGAMPEMRDNSFYKEPFTRNKYYKEYQEALSKR